MASSSLAATVLAVLGVAGVTVAYRRRTMRQVANHFARRHPVGPDGIVPGAASIVSRGNSAKRVLILHGFGDTPQSVRSLVDAFEAENFAVSAPLLPGHGRTLEALDQTAETDWLDAARAAWHAVCAEGSVHVLAGQSMGGALAVLLATERPPDLLLLASPFLSVRPSVARAARWSRFWGMVAPFQETSDAASIQDPQELAASLGYGAATARTLRALVRITGQARRALPTITVPTLVVQSREDNRIDADAARAAFAEIGARDKELVWRTGVGHVVLADSGRREVARLMVQWAAARIGATPDRSGALFS
jgi:carboxylesterase